MYSFTTRACRLATKALGPGLALALALTGFSGPAASSPPVEVTRLPPIALIKQCAAVMPRAHPWRARQLKSAMVGLRLSMSWRVAAHRLSDREVRAAAANERICYERLAETCRPLLS
jgi:hypothetical protein